MRNGTCTRCGGTEVYAAADAFWLGGGTQAALEAHIEPGFRGVRARQVTDGLWQYLCAACGYLEFYVIDHAAIDFARRAWLRVPRTPRAGATSAAE